MFIGSEPGPSGPSRNDQTIGAPLLPFYVYLLARQRHGTLYLGVTGDLIGHKTRSVPGFTAQYGVARLA